MKNINFIVKTVGIVLTVGVLLVYSSVAGKHNSQLKAHEQAVAEIEAHNAEVLRKLNEAPAGKYKDGEYEGGARGFRSDIKVKVTVANGAISAVEIVSADDDQAFFDRAKGVIDSIISTQSTEVDAVSGATFSSNGIINAVVEALKTAEG